MKVGLDLQEITMTCTPKILPMVIYKVHIFLRVPVFLQFLLRDIHFHCSLPPYWNKCRFRKNGHRLLAEKENQALAGDRSFVYDQSHIAQQWHMVMMVEIFQKWNMNVWHVDLSVLTDYYLYNYKSNSISNQWFHFYINNKINLLYSV